MLPQVILVVWHCLTALFKSSHKSLPLYVDQYILAVSSTWQLFLPTPSAVFGTNLHQCHHATRTLRMQEIHSSKLWSGNSRRKPNLSYRPEGHRFTQVKKVLIGFSIRSRIAATNGLAANMSWRATWWPEQSYPLKLCPARFARTSAVFRCTGGTSCAAFLPPMLFSAQKGLAVTDWWGRPGPWQALRCSNEEMLKPATRGSTTKIGWQTSTKNCTILFTVPVPPESLLHKCTWNTSKTVIVCVNMYDSM